MCLRSRRGGLVLEEEGGTDRGLMGKRVTNPPPKSEPRAVDRGALHGTGTRCVCVCVRYIITEKSSIVSRLAATFVVFASYYTSIITPSCPSPLLMAVRTD
jgi:hypothetical protein